MLVLAPWSDVLPLPPDLTVVSYRDQGCRVLRIRSQAPDSTDGTDDWVGPDDSAESAHSPAVPAERDGRPGQVLATLEHQILATVLQIVSGLGGVASFLRNLAKIGTLGS